MANKVLKGTVRVVYNNTIYDVHPKTEISEVEGYTDDVTNKISSATISATKVSGALNSASIAGSNITGTVATSKLNGTISGASISGALANNVSIAGSNITGNVPATIVNGTLANASIEAANVIGIEEFGRGGTGKRYGYRINKNESNPYNRVEYLYDATGFTPAHMDFENDTFDFGDWADAWFIKEIKPLMLKADGTVDYYLYENDYTKKADGDDVTTDSGVDSDLANADYSGTDNAMVQIPTIYVKRWEDENYIYEVICSMKYDSDYEAYAHTNANGVIKPYFYYSMFDGSGNATSIRSLPDKTVSKSLSATSQIQGAVANGTGWYIHSWSQRELIRTLCVLLGKSTDTQARFGTGRATSSGSTDSTITTGTLMNKGMFYGISENTSAVKVFHIENFWGNQWDRTAGLMLNYSNGFIYTKMTPEGEGYRINDFNGMTLTGAAPAIGEGKYIEKVSASRYGLIPIAYSKGSSSTYFADGYWRRSDSAYPSGNIGYLFAGGSSVYASALSGAFTFGVGTAPSRADWHIGCGLSYIAS